MEQSQKELINKKAKEYLISFISEVSPYFDEFFSKQKKIASQVSPVALDMAERYESYIGGKRLRGALTKIGYDLFGGQQKADILKVSSIIELIHGFALMHDDIYDEDEIRRNNPAMHIQYQQVFEKSNANSKKRNKELYGISMATNLGDIGSYYSNLVLLDTDFDAEFKLRFLRRLSEIVIQTVYGQAMDITFELDKVPSEEKVMWVHEKKTAWYTVPGPLQYGALLAGVEENDERYTALADFGVPVGIAFQLRDDELGMFSKQSEFGKPIFSDLRQGKNTVLFAKAFENASKEQYEFLYSVHGNSNVGAQDLEKVNEILVDTGALEYSQKLSWDLVEKGKSFIPKITANKNHQDLLELLANYVVTREK